MSRWVETISTFTESLLKVRSDYLWECHSRPGVMIYIIYWYNHNEVAAQVSSPCLLMSILLVIYMKSWTRGTELRLPWWCDHVSLGVHVELAFYSIWEVGVNACFLWPASLLWWKPSSIKTAKYADILLNTGPEHFYSQLNRLLWSCGLL